MSDQLRSEKQTAGKPDDSAFKMSNEKEQELIRDFQSPFPERDEREVESTLLRNADWRWR